MTVKLAIDAFKIRPADIRSVDCAQLHALSIGVGWPHRAEDWNHLREIGSGIAALDDIGRVLGSVMWFPHGASFAIIGMLITSPRLQTLGTGQWLMKQALSKCHGRSLRLNATQAARRLYLGLDFIPEKTLFQCQGEAHAIVEPPVAPAGTVVRRLEASHLAAMVDLDALAFGVARPALMDSLFARSVGYGLFRDDSLEAYALCRRFGRGHVVGPVVAGNDAAAMAVVHLHVMAHQAVFLRLDTYFNSGDFGTFLSKSGLVVFDTVLTMSYARGAIQPDASGPVTYAPASQALG